MKKTLVALAAVSAAAGAFAQSNVTIYGTLDASVAYVKNPTDNTGKSATYLNDSAISTSRWGMRGTEDLGGGLKANFNLESDVNMGTGANNPAGMFRRSAYVSLASDHYGELRLGRATSVAVAHLVSGGIVLPSNAMHGTMLIGAGLAGDFFVPNAITYVSPSLSGLRASLLYAPGEQAGDSSNGSAVHAAVKYQGSNFTIGGAYVNVDDLTGVTTPAFGRKWYTIDGTVTLGKVPAATVAHLARTHRVVVYDMLGHGASQAAIGVPVLADYARQLLDLLDALDDGTTEAADELEGKPARTPWSPLPPPQATKPSRHALSKLNLNAGAMTDESRAVFVAVVSWGDRFC